VCVLTAYGDFDVLIDFTPLRDKTVEWLEFAAPYTLPMLRAAINAYIDATLDIIGPATDAHLTFEPVDAAADDPYAPEEDRKIGWSLAHLVLHVTASLEEGAAFSSILARGISIGGRLRYEPDWRTFTTRAQVLERLEECRRMCLAYLDTWPNPPHLDVNREMPEDWVQILGQRNAPASVLGGLRHWDDHMDQFRDAMAQARKAIQA
jgi:hypothetical protein